MTPNYVGCATFAYDLLSIYEIVVTPVPFFFFFGKCLLSKEKFRKFFFRIGISKLISNVKGALCFILLINELNE